MSEPSPTSGQPPTSQPPPPPTSGQPPASQPSPPPAPPAVAPPPAGAAPPQGRRSGVLAVVGVGLAGLLLGGILGGGAVAAWHHAWGDDHRPPGHSRLDDRGDRGDRLPPPHRR